jgi:DNA topoisomerase-1
MPKKLVIVESPAKARTIGGYLGAEYIVESSIGHIRDIPGRAKDAPEKLQDEWRRTKYGVDVHDGFKPLYVVSSDKKKQVTKLRKLLKEVDEVYLATDEDREGEAIAWHLLEVLKPKVPVWRMVFHEITKSAIEAAVETPREIDRQLVDAQEARRILDRLYGYEISPVLWRKVRPKLSAGRVQSPATRIIVERERERMTFVAASYWDLSSNFVVPSDPGNIEFGATLVTVDEVRVAAGRDFSEQGELKSRDVTVLDEARAGALVAALADSDFSVDSIEAKPYTRRPYPPFRTSTLQQEAGRKLRFGTGRTMSAAQRLYENGLITYMRTDSTTLSPTALGAARKLVAARYGPEYLPKEPRSYSGKVKNAQEAHEAIRPAGEDFALPKAVASTYGPSSDEAKLYELIWKRTVASQMRDAKGESIAVRLAARAATGEDVRFAASGKTILFAGFLRAYVEGSDDPEAALDDQETHLPPMVEGEEVTALAVEAKHHQTKPPARYTEASLVKRLEELGIGRPSTYASIISRIQDRGYARKKGTALVPTLTAFATVALMEQHFADFVDYAFTARMEDDLDQIAAGDQAAVPWLEEFYFGNGHPGLEEMVASNLEAIDAREINSIALGDAPDGLPVVARAGRYGPYVQHGEDTASIPDETAPDELSVAVALELLAAPSGDKILGEDSESGLTVIAKSGRYGPYVQLGDPEPGSKTKPKTASLFKAMSTDSISLEEALQLLSQPRNLGDHPETGEPIMVQNGRYGPYIKSGKDTRSLEAEEEIFTIDFDAAVALLAQPKKRAGRRAVPPLKELGDDPVSKKPIVVKDGRWGLYVTDGETNASFRVADSLERIDLERAAELIQMRRDKQKS